MIRTRAVHRLALGLAALAALSACAPGPDESEPSLDPVETGRTAQAATATDAGVSTAPQVLAQGPVCAGAGPAIFPGLSFTAGANPDGVAAADLNADGRPDLAVANHDSNNVSILFNSGGGCFAAPVHYAIGAGPVAIALADVNNDGRSDLVVANDTGTVSVLLRNAGGTFQTARSFTAGTGPRAVTVADLNGDRCQDITVANATSGGLSVLLGNCLGGFAAARSYPVGTAPQSVAVADLNRDGRPDLVTASSGSQDVNVLLGRGDGTFQAARSTSVGYLPLSVTTGDFNRDGKPDVAVANKTAGRVQILTGDGLGGLTLVPAQTSTIVGQDLQVVLARDFNNDSKLDLAVASSAGFVALLTGNGDGTFQTPRNFDVGFLPVALSAADLDGNGRLDLALANGTSVSVLLGGSAGFSPAPVGLFAGNMPRGLAIKDLNGDGRDDLAVANWGGGDLGLLFGAGNGTFRAPQRIATGAGATGVIAADVTNDGRPDLAVANSGANTVSVLVGTGGGAFSAPRSYAVGGNPKSVASGDFNGDRRIDLAVGNDDSNNVSILLGNGDGTFQPAQTLTVSGRAGFLVAGRFNGDALDDLAVATRLQDTVTVFIASASGFQAPRVIAANGHPDWVTAGDLNGDRCLDLALDGPYSGAVYTLVGDCNGGFAAPQRFVTGGAAGSVAIADFDEDGRPDLVVTNGSTHTVVVLRGTGGGAFAAPVAFPGGAGVGPLAVGDLNGDGRPDVAALNVENNTNQNLYGVTLLVNQPAPLNVTVDPAVQPTRAALGTRPLAVVQDAARVRSTFIANEVMLTPRNASELSAFLTRTGGRVVADTSAPALVPGAAYPAGLTPPPVAYVIQLDPSRYPLTNLAADARAVGWGGDTRTSSDAATRLLALAAHERASGLAVDLNFVHESQSPYMPRSSELSGLDAFQRPEHQPTGSRSNVTRAWQFIAARGYSRRVRVAIIDRGFDLDANGNPASGRSDLPSPLVQYDFSTRSAVAGGANPHCDSTDHPCRWHGNGAASAALGRLDNGLGMAGTGGQVADPLLFKVIGADDQTASALRAAVFNGADIISMSFGRDCNYLCREFTHGYGSLLEYAHNVGRMLVAAAGNESNDALDHHVWPCQHTGVFCVGALGNGTLNAASYSNYGSTVNIWAPSGIRVMPNPESGGFTYDFHGTSASCPFVAGIAAMVKAVNPSLNGDAIGNVLARTAGRDSPDGRVTAYVDAYRAVLEGLGRYDARPAVTITLPTSANRTILQSWFNPITFSASATDLLDGDLPDAAVTWTSDVDGTLGTGRTITYDFINGREGPRRITATARNSSGITDTDTVTFTVNFVRATPQPVITFPQDGATIAAGVYYATGYAPGTDPGAIGNAPCSQLTWNGSIPATAVAGDPNRCQGRIDLSVPQNNVEIRLTAINRLGVRGDRVIHVNVVPATGLNVQIISPVAGSSYQYASEGPITLSGTASQLLPNSTLTLYSWYYYVTANGAGSKTFLGNGATFGWRPGSMGPCVGRESYDLTLRLEVLNEGQRTVPSQAPPTRDGFAEVPVHITCGIIP